MMRKLASECLLMATPIDLGRPIFCPFSGDSTQSAIECLHFRVRVGPKESPWERRKAVVWMTIITPQHRATIILDTTGTY